MIYEKVFFMKIPMMIRSEYCWLKSANDRLLVEFGECPLDQGGYFVINGSEKVLIALERMANNFVYAFEKKQPSKYTWVCEVQCTQILRAGVYASPDAASRVGEGRRRHLYMLRPDALRPRHPAAPRDPLGAH